MVTEAEPVDAGLRVGDIFLGKYRVESILGQGGMGVVAKCVHLGLGETFAIKVLRSDILANPEATERFTREAQAAGKLKSEHVARVIDVGTSDTGLPYMIMEYLDGCDLGQLVDKHGAIRPPFAAMLMLQAAEGLCDAHSHNIIHRDVKPSNLFVTRRADGSALVKVLDFGISKSTETTNLRLTQTQSMLGTPAHMSPEQMRSARRVDARSDIWSLGTVFYELLEGHPPFMAESFSEMCIKVVTEPPSPMVHAPPPLEQIVMRCLAKELDRRYQNLAEFGRDLLAHVPEVHQATLLVERMERMAALQPGVGVPRAMRDLGSQPIVGRPATSQPSPVTPLPAPSITTHASKRSRIGFGLIGVVGVTIALGAGYALWPAGEAVPPQMAIAPPQQPEPPKLVIAPDAGEVSVLASPKQPVALPPPGPTDADLAVLAPFEQLTKLAQSKPTCRVWNAEVRKRWERGLGGATRSRDELVTRPPFDKGELRGRLDEALAALVSMQAVCNNQIPGVAVARPMKRQCPAGQRLTPAGCTDEIVEQVVQTPPSQPPPPPSPPPVPPAPTEVRSPNGQCSLADRLPSGNWPPRCM